MRTYSDVPSPLEPRERTDHVSVGPDLPIVGSVPTGSVLFLTCGILMLTVIGIPFGIPMFAVGPGLMLEPRRRDTR